MAKGKFQHLREGAPTYLGESREVKVAYLIRNTAAALRHQLMRSLKEVKLELRGGSYTPIAVFKAFAKIGLTLLPDEEVKNFSETLSWVRNPDHSTGFVKNCSIVYTFVPGPMPSNVIVPRLLRRKPQSNNLPYIFLILGFGNCLIQIWLPCRKKDQHIWGTTLEVPPFPPVIAPKPTIYGSPSTRVLDMSGREQVTQENRSHRFRGTNIEIRG